MKENIIKNLEITFLISLVALIFTLLIIIAVDSFKHCHLPIEKRCAEEAKWPVGYIDYECLNYLQNNK